MNAYGLRPAAGGLERSGCQGRKGRSKRITGKDILALPEITKDLLGRTIRQRMDEGLDALEEGSIKQASASHNRSKEIRQ